MGDVIKVPLQIGGSGVGEATAINQILHGTVSIDLPSVAAAGAVGSASAAINGMTSAFSVLLLPRAWVASESVIIAAAVGIAGGVQVTATNPSAVAIDATAATFQYFAWR